MLRQALHEAHHGPGAVRQAACDFWANPAHLRYWEDGLGLPEGLLARQVQAVLRTGR